MDFLGMGPLEILLILILGFLFLGPEKLPRMARKTGHLYRKFKKASFDLTRNITEDFSEEKRVVDEDVAELNRSIRDDLAKNLDEDRKMVGEDLSKSGQSAAADIQSENQERPGADTAVEPPPATGKSPENKRREEEERT
jgi:Sec-independent protein translocase protein TatA